MRTVRPGLLAGLLLAAAWPAPAGEPDSLKGDEKETGDVKFARIDLPAKELAPPLAWADEKGTAFYALTRNGVLWKVSFPDFVVKEKKDLGRKCSWLAVSKEGLLVTVPDPQEVWVVDPAKLSSVKKKIAVPNVQRAVSAPNLSVAVAGGGDKFRGGGLSALDLKTGKATPMEFPPDPDAPRRMIGKDRPVISPDGKYLFTEGYEQITRFVLARGKWKFEESSPRIAQGPTRGGIIVSPDSKFVCLPSGGGNYGAGYATHVYPINSFQKRQCTLETGPYPAAVGFDPAGGYIYGQNARNSLILFGPTGVKKKEYKLGPGGLDVSQYLVHPAGNKVLIVMKDYVYYAETTPAKE